MDDDTGESSRRRQPLARGVELLTLMVDGERDEYGVRDLSTRVGLSPSTVHRLLGDLERLGLIARTPESTYRLGLEFLRLAWTTSDRYPLHEASTDTLRALTAQSGESSFFGVYNPQRRQMMFTLTEESPHPLRYAIPINDWLPLHAGASGIAILAFLPEDIQSRVAGGPLPATTERTLVDKAGLLDRLRVVRETGYAVTSGERIEGAVAIAAPVFGPTGIVGVTGISLPQSRFHPEDEARLGELVRASAAKLTQRIAGDATVAARRITG